MYAGCAYGPREIWGFRVKHRVRSAYYPREIFFGISRDPPLCDQADYLGKREYNRRCQCNCQPNPQTQAQLESSGS